MRRAWAIVFSVLVASGACATGGDKKPAVYVAVGDSETVGIGADDPATQSWASVFFRTARLPAKTRYVNLGISGAKVQTALDKELAGALAAKPTVVTVWLNVNDIIGRTDVAAYEPELRRLVHALRRDGKARVLVANTPPLEILPSVRPFASVVSGFVDQYNAAIGRVVRSEHVELVDLHAAGLAAEQAGTSASLIGKDGFHTSTAGHAAVAAEFVKVYQHPAER